LKNTPRAAAGYDLFMSPLDRVLLHKWRRFLWSRVRGPQVLEVGVGTGLNIPHYPAGLHITALDKGEHYLERARGRAGRLNKSVYFLQGDVQALPFADQVFDTVLSSFLFCSVQDPHQGLRELHRVLKSGGQLLLLEHGASRGLLGRFMNALSEPLYRLTGEHIARDTEALVQETGFLDVQRTPFLLDVVKLVSAEKGALAE
jgi:phosphatidylethanolamine/phosphatidyl-N-methylethanolamine N-methyltransferase